MSRLHSPYSDENPLTDKDKLKLCAKQFMSFIQSLDSESIANLGINPTLVSGNVDKHDCDSCPNDPARSELHDPQVCKDCWKDAIKERFGL